MELQIPFAIRDDNDLIYSPEKASKEFIYRCPVCNEIVTLKQGFKKIAHFSHKATSKCTKENVTETILHKKAKKVFEKHNRIPLPLNDDYVIFNNSYFYYEKVFLEKRLDTIIPDIILESFEGEQLLVEIVVYNNLSEEKIKKLKDLNVPCLVINLNSLIKKIGIDKLNQDLLELWIFYPNANYDLELNILNELEKLVNKDVLIFLEDIFIDEKMDFTKILDIFLSLEERNIDTTIYYDKLLKHQISYPIKYFDKDIIDDKFISNKYKNFLITREEEIYKENIKKTIICPFFNDLKYDILNYENLFIMSKSTFRLIDIFELVSEISNLIWYKEKDEKEKYNKYRYYENFNILFNEIPEFDINNPNCSLYTIDKFDNYQDIFYKDKYIRKEIKNFAHFIQKNIHKYSRIIKIKNIEYLLLIPYFHCHTDKQLNYLNICINKYIDKLLNFIESLDDNLILLNLEKLQYFLIKLDKSFWFNNIKDDFRYLKISFNDKEIFEEYDFFNSLNYKNQEIYKYKK